MSLWTDILARLRPSSTALPPGPTGSPAAPPANPSIQAPILARSDGRIRFAVDDVTPAPAPLPTIDLDTVVTYALRTSDHRAQPRPEDRGVIAMQGIGPFVAGPCAHPLASAVQRAFVEHRPLVLTPDVIWLTIANGVARHVDQNAESLRSFFVKHEGRATITVEGPPDGQLDATGWAGAIGGWTGGIREAVPAEMVELFECNFSTSTPECRTAAAITMMGAFKQYFEYEMMCVCGIPEVELRGTVADWRRIRARVDVLAVLDLEWWAERLRPVCDAFVATADGRPERAFWQQIHIPLAIYGGQSAVGWIIELFPYRATGVDHATFVRNPAFAESYSRRLTRGGVPGFSPADFPSALCVAPIVQRWPDGRERHVDLLGGLLGVRQTGLDLEPVAGWLVRLAPPLRQALARIRAVAVAVPESAKGSGRPDSLAAPADLRELSATLAEVRRGVVCDVRAGDAMLWASPRSVLVAGEPGANHPISATAFGALSDGRVVACARDGNAWRWLAGRSEMVPEDRVPAGKYQMPPREWLREVTTIAPDLATFLDGLTGVAVMA